MTNDEMPIRTRLFLPDLLMTIFLRMVAVGCLWFALVIWGDLVGYGRGGRMRFDLIGSDMKAAGAALAVLYPVAAIGLWLKGRWGPVIWSVAAAVEMSMHQGFPETFGRDNLMSALIATTLLVYIVLRLAAWWLRPANVAQEMARR